MHTSLVSAATAALLVVTGLVVAPAAHAAPAPVQSTRSQVMYVQKDKVPLRTARAAGSKTVKTLRVGTKVQTTTAAPQGTRHQVRLAGGRKGWVDQTHLTHLKVTMATSKARTKVRFPLRTSVGRNILARTGGTMASGATVNVRARWSGYAYVERNGRRGWLPSAYLISASTVTAPSAFGRQVQAAARNLAKQYGVPLVWTRTDALGRVGSVTRNRYRLPGSYSGGGNSDGRGLIRMSFGTDDPGRFSDRTMLRNGTLNTVRHEISHGLIERHCGTTRPAVAGKRPENVTDAYTYLYMKPSGKADKAGGYGFTSKDLSAAKKIRAGKC